MCLRPCFILVLSPIFTSQYRRRQRPVFVDLDQGSIYSRAAEKEREREELSRASDRSFLAFPTPDLSFRRESTLLPLSRSTMKPDRLFQLEQRSDSICIKARI